MQTRTSLAKLAQAWLDEAGSVPPGNGGEAALWGGGDATAGVAASDADIAAMSPSELADYQERKLKMRKAMGEATADGAPAPAGAEDSPEERRLKMIAAMEVGRGGAVHCRKRTRGGLCTWEPFGAGSGPRTDVGGPAPTHGPRPPSQLNPICSPALSLPAGGRVATGRR